MYRERLAAEGADDETLARIDREVGEAIDRATDEAKNGPLPDPDDSLQTELWADGGSAWRS
jgi:pyruvate dehydrogenase E1 component alpha subunit